MMAQRLHKGMSRPSSRKQRHKLALKPTALYKALETIKEDEDLVTLITTWQYPNAWASKSIRKASKRGRRRKAKSKVGPKSRCWPEKIICIKWFQRCSPTAYSSSNSKLSRWVVETNVMLQVLKHVRRHTWLTNFQFHYDHVQWTIAAKFGSKPRTTTRSCLR